MGFVREYFRRKALRRWSSDVPTAMLPFAQLKSAAVLMDVETPGFQDARESVVSWLKASGIRTEVHFFDFRKLEKNELLTTSIQNTVLRKDLNWFGMPGTGKAPEICCDLFISLVPDDSFPARFYASCCRSRFKVGICTWEGAPFDLVVDGGSGASLLEVLDKIRECLGYIAPAESSADFAESNNK